MSRALAAVALTAALAAGCSRNPATGERQLMLVDERGEIAMGHDADQQVTARLGLVPDAALQEYVSRVGRRLAATAERPELPWSFRVVDDAAVNAFALPGGYVYVTRGLLAHLNSEAELAAVLGHEIGHVTARHSTSRASQARVAALGLGIGVLLQPSIARNLELAEAGLGLAMLKFARDDERAADVLGVRYVERSGYTTRGVASVLAMLGRVEAAQPDDPARDWLSTHPGSDGRVRAVEPLLRGGGAEARLAYLRAIDGLVYGDDPRAGYRSGRSFVLPQLGLRLELPTGWSARNAGGAVTSVSPGGEAVLSLGVAEAGSARAAAEEFGVGGSRLRAQPARHEGPLWVRDFAHDAADGATYRGVACFAEHGRRVLRLLGYARASAFERHRAELMGAMMSLAPAAESGARRPLRRVQVVDLGPLRLTELSRGYPSVVPPRTIALLNGLDPGDPDAVVPQPVKRVVGAATE